MSAAAEPRSKKPHARDRARALLLLGLGCTACRGPAAEPATPPPRVVTAVLPAETAAASATPSADELPPAPPPARAACTPPGCWVIDDGGVGELRLGAPLALADLGPEPAKRFFARTIADAQPVEGFRLDAPPLAVAVRPRMGTAAGALGLARQGRLLVAAVYVEGPGPETARGAGVGATLGDLARLHGAPKPHDVPPTWGHDECAVAVPDLENVWFYFESCERARGGAPSVRVGVYALAIEDW
ncbi:MAG: hypothetical protein IT373_08340 [Polyangiaceae bacterium]|nr:hypothetical protein [Polyangiaceae bacterium]